VSQAEPMTWANGDSLTAIFRLPIVGLSATTDNIVVPTRQTQPAGLDTMAATAISTSTVTYLGFSNSQFDDSSNFTNVGSASNTTYTSTTYYTAPMKGKYRVSAQYHTTDADMDSNERYDIRIYVNGAEAKSRSFTAFATVANPTLSPHISVILDLSKGDDVSVVAYHEAAADMTMTASAPLSFFQVEQVDAGPILGGFPFTNSSVHLDTANGADVTNTRFRKFSNSSVVGSDMSYADDGGAKITINTAGIYSFTFNFNATGASTSGLSLNSTAGTTDIYSITNTDILCMDTAAASGYNGCAVWTGRLEVGDFIRMHIDGTATPSTNGTNFVWAHRIGF
jgi:hypothetical protein